jgi:hypothetical protein
MGRRLLSIALCFLSLSAVSTAIAVATPRQDPYYEVWCQLGDADPILVKVVDSNAIQIDKDPGGKDTATDQYNNHNPQGWVCWEVGPISP